jgi:hypothetical protein
MQLLNRNHQDKYMVYPVLLVQFIDCEPRQGCVFT